MTKQDILFISSGILIGLMCSEYGGPYEIGDDVLFADDTVVSKDTQGYVKAKEINVGYIAGTLRIAFDTRDPSGAEHWVHAWIHKNGVAFGAERSQNSVWNTYTEDLAFEANDLLQLYVKNNDSGFPIEVRNFRILGKFLIPEEPAINEVS